MDENDTVDLSFMKNLPISTLEIHNFQKFAMSRTESKKLAPNIAESLDSTRSELSESHSEQDGDSHCHLVSSSAEFILDSLAGAMFDAVIYLDDQLNILADSPRLCALLGIDSSSSTGGKPFAELISSADDVERFQRFMRTIPETTATQIELSLMRSNVRLYITRTNAGSTTLFVGLQMQTSASSPAIPPRLAPTVFQQESRAPSLIETVQSTYGGRQSLSYQFPGVSYGKDPGPPPSVSLVSVFYRGLNNDLLYMANSVELAPHPSTEVGWLTQHYIPSDLPSLAEDLVRLLPNKKQEEFLNALSKHDLWQACNLLQQTTLGNLNFLSFGSGMSPTSSVQHLCATCRLILGHLPQMEASSIIPFFNEWIANYDSLNVFCSSMRAKIGLTLITCAIKHPDKFSSEEERERLSGIFSKLVSTTDSFGITDSVRLLAVYSASMLWAHYQLNSGEEQGYTSAVNLLEACMKDMDIFSLRHPGSALLKQLRGIACFNLASLALKRGDITKASMWISELQEIAPKWISKFENHPITTSERREPNPKFELPFFMSDY